jgi:RND family efflux transporter MFP subunit
MKMQRIPLQRSLALLAGMFFMGLVEAQFGGAPVVRVDTAVIRSMSATTLVAGTVVSRNDANLAAEVEGRLVFVLDVGSFVAEGDPVARIEDTMLRLRHDELVAEVSRVEAGLAFLRNEERRFARLAESNLAAATQLEQTRADRGVAAGDLAVAKARLAQNDEQLSRTVIRAPFEGVIVERLLMPGEHVSEGHDVVRLVDQQHLEVIARAPLEYIRFTEPGQALRVAAGDIAAEAAVRTVVAVGDEDTHQFELRLDIESGLFPVGQTLRVSVPTSDLREVLVVHRDALVLRPESITVFVVEADDSVRQVPVSTGVGSGNLIEVRGDLQPGARVVVRGNERLQAGQQVNVAEG